MKTRMLRTALTAFVMLSLAAVFALSGCQKVEKPDLKGSGPLKLNIQAGILSPEYHQPVEYWKTHHMDLVKRGDYSIQECTLCHNVHTSCNNCHDYVGVNRVEGYE